MASTCTPASADMAGTPPPSHPFPNLSRRNSGGKAPISRRRNPRVEREVGVCGADEAHLARGCREEKGVSNPLGWVVQAEDVVQCVLGSLDKGLSSLHSSHAPLDRRASIHTWIALDPSHPVDGLAWFHKTTDAGGGMQHGLRGDRTMPWPIGAGGVACITTNPGVHRLKHAFHTPVNGRMVAHCWASVFLP